MFLCELRIENLRMYGEGEQALLLPLLPGLTALVGENDSGKTAIIDALRLALGTRDQEVLRVDELDFHQPLDGAQRRMEIRIRCKFDDLTRQDIAAFLEYLTYEARGSKKVPVLYVNWKANDIARGTTRRRTTFFETRSGQSGDGPSIDSQCKSLLCSTLRAGSYKNVTPYTVKGSIQHTGSEDKPKSICKDRTIGTWEGRNAE